MRVLICSPAFLPHLGGVEVVVATVARELCRRGVEVGVVTRTPGAAGEATPYRVVRRPSRRELLRWVAWCDVYFQANVSLRELWPLLLIRRPWAVSHHSWYRRGDGRIGWRDRLKRRLLPLAAVSIAASRALAQDLQAPAEVIPNPYRDDLFRRLPGIERAEDLIFVGRLVSDKGADLLLEALARLAGEALRPRLTVVGEGPEAEALRRLAGRLGLDAQVRFLGSRAGEELAVLLNRHRILVVPSRYREPFGVVALEGIACGCAVVGSAGGGLREAVGPCGVTFPNGDPQGLAAVLADLLRDPGRRARLHERAPEHLAAHSAAAVGDAYLHCLERACGHAARAARIRRSGAGPPP